LKMMKGFMNKKIKYQKGFSLIEIVVVASIMSFMSLAMAQLFTSLNNQNQALLIKQDAQSVVNELRSVISDTNVCRNALVANQNIDESKSSEVVNGGLISSTLGAPFRLQLGGTGSTVEANQIVQSYKVRTNYLNFTDSELVQIDPGTNDRLYRGRLWVSLSKAEGSLPGPSDFRPQLVGSFFVQTTDAGVATECFGINDDPSKNPVTLASLCTSIRSGSDTGVYDAGSGECRLPASAPVAAATGAPGCPPGQYLQSGVCRVNICGSGHSGPCLNDGSHTK